MTDLEHVLSTVRSAAGLGTDSATPLYRRLERAIRQAVDSGTIGTGEAIPSERDLASRLDVSRVTVRNAVRALVADGVLQRRQGAGTFVAPRVEQPLSRLTGFTEDMRARGRAASSRWLARGVGHATPNEALALALSPGAPVSRLHRLRLADGNPMCLEQASLPREHLPDPDAVAQSLYAALTERGAQPVRALQRLRAQPLDGEDARLLHVAPGAAGLYIERRSFLADGRPVEFVRSCYRGDSYDFVAELHL